MASDEAKPENVVEVEDEAKPEKVVDVEDEEMKDGAAAQSPKGEEAPAEAEAEPDFACGEDQSGEPAAANAEGGAVDAPMAATPEAPAKPEAPKELEEDAQEDSRKRLAAAVAVNSCDTTLNVLPSCGGKLLMSLGEGGFQHLIAAARANAGITAGRYLFEVRVIECRSHGGDRSSSVSKALQFGFTAGGSSLFLGDGPDSVGFDSEGTFLQGGNRAQMFRESHNGRFPVFGVLLNVDAQSPNANTVSLFRDGARVGKPQPLPEALQGKALYPTVNYKNVTVRMNFGPKPLVPLPFVCRTVQDAAEADVELAKLPEGAGEVVFPVGLPNEGTFDWVDRFMKAHPDYVELSDRAVIEWARKSGMSQSRGYKPGCNDRPGFDFGVREMDDMSIRRVIQSVAPSLRRNYVVMEMRNNLIGAERSKASSCFDGYKKVAAVLMGEPDAAHKDCVRERLLEAKREQAAKDAKRAWETKQRETAEKKRKKEQEERQKKENEDKKENGKESGEEKGADAKEDAAEMEEEAPETLEEAVKKAQDAVELTEEEAKQWFVKSGLDDIDRRELGNSFTKFTIPDKEEGFDEIRFEWQKTDECATYLKKWVLERKLTQRVEDLRPGAWFNDKWNEWQKLYNYWGSKHSEYKADPTKKQREEAEKRREERETRRRERQEARKAEKAKKEEEAKAKKAADDAEAKEAGEKKDDVMDVDAEDEKKEEEKKEEQNVEEEEEDCEEVMDEEPKKIDVDALDVFAVEDICDIGSGEPLFAHFTWEDWDLLSLRFEMHLLLHAFRRDINDPERPTFHESLLGHYYNTYNKKQVDFKKFGCAGALELLELVKDTVAANRKSQVLEAQLCDDTPLENLVRLTENERRERQIAVDLGDESAALKFQRYDHSNNRGGGGRDQYNQGGYNRGGGQGYSSRNAPPPAPVSGRGHQQGGGVNTMPLGQRGSSHQSSSYGGRSEPPRSGYGADRKGGDRGSSNGAPPPPPSRGGYSSGYGSSAQKRPYSSSAAPAPSYNGSRAEAPKQARTSSSSYGGGGAGGSSYGQRSGGSYGGHGSSGGYSRR